MIPASATFQDALSTLLTSHVVDIVRSFPSVIEHPIAQFAPVGSTFFVVYGPKGTPLAYGGVCRRDGASGRHAVRREVERLAATGVGVSYRAIELPEDDLVSVIGRMIVAFLGDSIQQFGEAISSKDGAVPVRGRRGKGTGAGATKRGGKRGPRRGKGGAEEPLANGTEATAAPSKKTSTKRGRRQKIDAGDGIAVKRGPGRPPASGMKGGQKRGRRAARPESEKGGVPTKKRMGRPPGSKNKSR